MPHSQPKACDAASSNHCHVEQTRSIKGLAADACDAVMFVHDCHQAFEAIECLLTPIRASDSAEIDLDRSQIGALFRVLNEAMRTKIEKAVHAANLTHRSA